MSEVNRLLASKSAVSNRNKIADKSFRRARTRTLIQIGGLVNLVGLLSFCGIEEGDDLQLDLVNMDKAATLVGFLIESFEKVPQEPSKDLLDQWKNIGTRVIKKNKYSKL